MATATIATLNLGLLVISSAFFTLLYGYSVGPARLETKIGPQAYARCSKVRAVGIFFMGLVCAAYVVYRFFPTDTALPRTFAWGWPVSIGIGLGLTGIATWIMWLAGRAAGRESFVPNKTTELYGGIYTRVRHPQAIGDVLYFFALAFLLNSPFIVTFSLIWIPIYYALSRLEERDLRIRFGADYEAYMRRTGMFYPRARTPS